MPFIDSNDQLIEAMRLKLRSTRLIFYSQISSALEDTFLYSIKLADNIGEISYADALIAARDYFNDRIDTELREDKKDGK
jgi:hypothetical protein